MVQNRRIKEQKRKSSHGVSQISDVVRGAWSLEFRRVSAFGVLGNGKEDIKDKGNHSSMKFPFLGDGLYERFVPGIEKKV